MIVETIQELRADWKKEGLSEGRKLGKEIGKEIGEKIGKKIGKEEGVFLVAANLLKEGSDHEFVAKVTGLSMEQVKKIKRGEFRLKDKHL